jgi:hypothetical protein
MKKLIALIVSLCMLVGMLPAVAETAAEAPAEPAAAEAQAAEAPAEAEKVDMNHLIDQLLNDVVNATIRVDVEESKKAGATPESSKGNVFTVLHQVLSDIAEAKEKQGKENEDLKKLLTFDPNADEKEIEALYAVVLLGLIAEADEKAANQGEDADPAAAITNANAILKAVYEGCQANETLAAAVKATDSKLFEMLEENNKHIKEYVEKNGALTVANIEVEENSYAEFEAEIKKLEDYLNGLEGKKQGALDLLSLLHAVMDDIHEAIDGHSHVDAKEVDHYSLVGEMLNDLMEAISKVNLDDVKSKAGDSFDISGSVYAVLEKVVNNVMADEVIKEKEADDKMAVILEMIGKVAEQDVTEEEAEAVFALLAAGDEKIEEAKEVDPEVDFLRSSHIMKAVYETMMENEVVKAAIEATGSKLPEMLVNSGERMKKYVEENKTLHEVKDVDEAPFVAFEAEFAKLRDHIAALEDGTVGKAKALGLLNLLHEYVDDIHEAVDGHAHEDVEKQAAAFAAGAAFGKSLQEIEDAFGRADFEVDQEHTHGPVTFTELEYENASLDGMHADEHYLFVEDKLVAFTICFKDGAVTFDSVVADLAKMYGEAKELDQTVLANGIYAVDDDGKVEGKAAAITVGDMMIIIAEDKDEVEVSYVDLTAAYIAANA